MTVRERVREMFPQDGVQDVHADQSDSWQSTGHGSVLHGSVIDESIPHAAAQSAPVSTQVTEREYAAVPCPHVRLQLLVCRHALV